MERLLDRVDELYSEMVTLRRKFHAYPELSFEEVETPKKIAAYLKELGVEVKTGVGGRGVVGYIRGKKPGKTVALRADFDALPIQEQTGLSFASTNDGVMHACGHDGHTAILLGLAKTFMEYRDELAGTVVLIHQHAEELAPGGAIAMIEDGCLDGVDVIYGTHLWTPMRVGTIGYRSGPIMAAADRFSITIHGEGGHGASPHTTVDSIATGAMVVNALQQIVSRNINPLQSAVVSVGSFQAGSGFNVIADSAEIIGTVRTFDPDVQQYVKERIEEITAGICEAMGATFTYDYGYGYPAVVNDETETNTLVRAGIELLGKKNVNEMPPEMAGEDFSYYLQHVPGTLFFTGAGNAEKGLLYPHHHPKFNFDENAMRIAAKCLAKATLLYLENE